MLNTFRASPLRGDSALHPLLPKAEGGDGRNASLLEVLGTPLCLRHLPPLARGESGVEGRPTKAGQGSNA